MLSEQQLEKARELKVADNFSLYEFLRSSHTNLIIYPSEKIVEQITSFAKNTLQKIRDKFGPISIHSGYRNPKLNKKVGGVPNSVHQYRLNDKRIGEASDISPKFSNYDLETVFEWIIDNHEELGVKTAIIYRRSNVVRYASRFIHLDTRESRPKFQAFEKFGPGDYRPYKKDE